jgi:TP901 family phage tail tape measure protein
MAANMGGAGLNFGFNFYSTGTAGVLADLNKIHNRMNQMTANAARRPIQPIAGTQGLSDLDRMGKKVDDLTTRAGRFTGAFNFDKATERSRKFYAFSYSRLGKLSIIGRGWEAFIIAGVDACIKAFVEFEKEATNAFVLINEESAKFIGGLEGLMSKMKDFGSEFGQQLTSVASGFKEALGSGVDISVLEPFMEIAGKLAVGGGTTLDKAQKGLITLANAFGIPYSDVKALQEISDALFAGYNFGITTIEELSKNLYKSASGANVAGAAYNEMVAAGSALTTVGTTTRFSFMSLERMFLNLINPSKKYKELMDEMGIVTGENAVQMNGGLLPTLLKINDAMKEHGVNVTDVFQQTNAQRAFNTLTAGFNKIGLTYENFSRMIEADRTFQEYAQRSGVSAKQLMTEVYGAMILDPSESQSALDRIAAQYGTTVGELRNLFEGTTAGFVAANKTMGTSSMAFFRQLYHPTEGLASEIGTITEDAYAKHRATLAFQSAQAKANFQIMFANAAEEMKPFLSYMLALTNTGMVIIQTVGKAWEYVFGDIGGGLEEVTKRLVGYQDKLRNIFKPVEVDISSKEFKDFMSLPIEERMRNVRGLTVDMAEAFAVSKLETADWTDKLRNFIGNLKAAVEVYGEFKAAMLAGDIGRLAFLAPVIDKTPLFEFVQTVDKVTESIQEKFGMLKDAWTGLWRGFAASSDFGKSMATLGKAAAVFGTIAAFAGPFRAIAIAAGGIAVAMKAIGTDAAGVGESLGSGMSNLITALSPIVEQAYSLLKTLFDGLSRMVRSIATEIGPPLMAVFKPVANIVSNVIWLIEALIPPLSVAISGIASAVGSVISGLTPYIGTIWSVAYTVISAIINIVQQLGPAIATVAMQIGGFIQNVLVALYPVFEFLANTVNGLITLVTPLFSGIIEALVSLFNVIVSVGNLIAGVVGPIFGIFFGDMNKGFDKSSKDVASFGESVGDIFRSLSKVLNDFKKTLDSLTHGLRWFMGALPEEEMTAGELQFKKMSDPRYIMEAIKSGTKPVADIEMAREKNLQKESEMVNALGVLGEVSRAYTGERKEYIGGKSPTQILAQESLGPVAPDVLQKQIEADRAGRMIFEKTLGRGIDLSLPGETQLIESTLKPFIDKIDKQGPAEVYKELSAMQAPEQKAVVGSIADTNDSLKQMIDSFKQGMNLPNLAVAPSIAGEGEKSAEGLMGSMKSLESVMGQEELMKPEIKVPDMKEVFKPIDAEKIGEKLRAPISGQPITPFRPAGKTQFAPLIDPINDLGSTMRGSLREMAETNPFDTAAEIPKIQVPELSASLAQIAKDQAEMSKSQKGGKEEMNLQITMHDEDGEKQAAARLSRRQDSQFKNYACEMDFEGVS